MHNEDRELQIRLAELEADVEISLTSCFGIIAMFVAVILFFEELFFLPSTSDLIKVASFLLIASLSVALFFQHDTL
jgi:hypothetical protein